MPVTRLQNKAMDDQLKALMNIMKRIEERGTDFVKASQLVASLRGSAMEILQGIPADKLTDLTTIEKALESRFTDSHLTQFYRTELKTRRQKSGESLQVLAIDAERLKSLFSL
ncbi:CCHC-type domain-containing protein [Nephila pilipes]|uniref:CCHC-type domain-containing protein n=1 Tax=Nephila pilipes TaxID=299642 RepID=A0A8X6TBL1_NEPPI|nr:CCHC-type domain-containing protein [Nephila pilipes]